jgi:hypothetical protein
MGGLFLFMPFVCSNCVSSFAKLQIAPLIPEPAFYQPVHPKHAQQLKNHNLLEVGGFAAVRTKCAHQLYQKNQQHPGADEQQIIREKHTCECMCLKERGHSLQDRGIDD